MRIIFKPHNKHIKRNQGFRAKMKTKDGRRVLRDEELMEDINLSRYSETVEATQGEGV